MDTASTPESGTSERTADLLAAAKDSSPAEPDKAPIKTADLLAADVVSTAGSPGNRKATGTGKGADNAAESPTPTATTKAAPPTDSQPAASPPLDDEGGLDGMTNEVPTNVFNSPGPASNVVFILDHSLSMRNNHKSIVARHELVNTLETMNPAQKFYVMFFHSGGFVGMPTPGPVDATPENIHAMTNWLFSVGHKFGSDPTIAVKNALGLVPTPDTLWLLSDGKFSAKAVAAIRDSNDLNVHINTIGFYSRQGEQTLRQIAEENRGTYRFIPPPAPTAARAPDGNSP
jgi:hypothetical protein